MTNSPAVDETVLGYPAAMYRSFERKGGSAPTATHYCPGCGHGILHKLLGEALADLDIQDRTVLISPVGCAVFAYYYIDCGNVQAAHGRAAAVATGISRVVDHAVVISYQGDGDLCSIGFNEAFQAANRGDRMVIFFVNNAVYGMTGGQMAPTTLPGQKTTTSPNGRDVSDTGGPIHMCELLDTLAAPVYIERCSLANIRRIRKARRAVRNALEVQRDSKGFAFVELLSPCPVNLHCSPLDAARFVAEEMEKEFPVRCFRDRSADVQPRHLRTPQFGRDALDGVFDASGRAFAEARVDSAYKPRHIRIAGFGGQGVLSLGTMVAAAGAAAARFVTWLPSYGPEQRGGTANCSVVISGQPVGSPIFREADVLIALNRPSLERFGDMVIPSGLILYDAGVGDYSPPPGVRALAVPALSIAAEAGEQKAANTAMLGALAVAGNVGLDLTTYRDALLSTFEKKPAVLRVNEAVLAAAEKWAQAHPAA